MKEFQVKKLERREHKLMVGTIMSQMSKSDKHAHVFINKEIKGMDKR